MINKLSQSQIDHYFLKALSSAFPSFSDLRMMLYYNLEINLEIIVSPYLNLREIISNLIKFARCRGEKFFKKLVNAARKENPGNDDLTRFYFRYTHNIVLKDKNDSKQDREENKERNIDERLVCIEDERILTENSSDSLKSSEICGGFLIISGVVIIGSILIPGLNTFAIANVIGGSVCVCGGIVLLKDIKFESNNSTQILQFSA